MIEEFEEILREAHKSVEDALALEDQGYIKLGTANTAINILPDDQRKQTVLKARIYAHKDPLCKQAIRLWTDYSFGTGMTWNAKNTQIRNILTAFWESPVNSSVFSARGQRKCSDKLLIDGEIFFAIFLGPETAIRVIDPLEITQIISSPDDSEDILFFRRDWATPQGKMKFGYYRNFTNLANKETLGPLGGVVRATEEALIYHFPINTTGQRGNSLLLPVIDWVHLFRRFLAARVAIILALARFAWKVKAEGNQTQMDAIKAVYEDQYPAAGSTSVENKKAELTPIKTDTGARNAYEDGRMLKLQVASGTGWPEQYFGDISIGNLATAKTVELPVSKMCQSYQAMWAGVYKDIDNLVLDHANVTGDRFVDRDFPAITPEDQTEMAKSIQTVVNSFPKFANLHDVMQAALLSIGINNVDEVLTELEKLNKELEQQEEEQPEEQVLKPGEEPPDENNPADKQKAKGNGKLKEASLELLTVLRKFKAELK